MQRIRLLRWNSSGSTNAYLTAITDPLSHSATFVCGYADGQLTSSKDVNNNQVTYYKCNLLQQAASSADGGPSERSRLPRRREDNLLPTTAMARPQQCTTAKLITSGTSISTTTTFDGIGRSGTQLTDPDGITATRRRPTTAGPVLQQRIPTAAPAIRRTAQPPTPTMLWEESSGRRAGQLKRLDQLFSEPDHLVTEQEPGTNASALPTLLGG